jgi:hypothetical protein
MCAARPRPRSAACSRSSQRNFAIADVLAEIRDSGRASTDFDILRMYDL